MKSTISFYDIYKVIMKHIWVVIASVIVCLGGLLALSKTPIEQQYQANTQVLVYPTKQNLINYQTLADIAQSKDVLKATITKYNKNVDKDRLKYDEFLEMVSTSGNGASQVITLSVAESTGKSAKKISKYFAQSFVKTVKANLPVRNVSIISSSSLVPQISGQPTQKLSTKKAIMFGIAAGVLLGIVLALSIEAVQHRHARMNMTHKKSMK